MSMSDKPLASALTLWVCAYLGCASFLIAGLLVGDSVSVELLAQLSWLALIGSIPTTLVLAAASRASGASKAVMVASLSAVALLTAAIGWEHADFLLSGPHWMFHPRRAMARLAMVCGLGLLGGGGWWWLISGMRSEGRSQVAVWAVLTMTAVALLAGVMLHYRAYDSSMAQLVFPAGVLCSAIVHLLVRKSSWRVVALMAAVACVVFALGSRFNRRWVATGQREVIAHSRAGALASLYVLPHRVREVAFSATTKTCAEPKLLVEQSAIGIGPDGRRNVVIITVDALRKDVVGLQVEGKPVTPELSRLAKTGVYFAHATSTYPATLFAVGSAFTGLSPAELYLSPALPDTIFTRSRGRVDQQLAVLPDVSWFRLPIVEQFLAAGVDITFAPTDAGATDALIARLRDARADDASVMAWIHYYAPHEPYQSRRAFPFGRGAKNTYLSEVAYFDHELGRLLAYLQEDGWLDDTLVVFFSDHGEALGERSYFGHHVYLDAWMIDVPLVLWHAGLAAAEPRVGVSLADVAPTVLHFLGLPMPSDVAAQSLFTLDRHLADRPTFSEAFPVRGRELFETFRLSRFDDASIRARLRGIRVSSESYEPKGAITRGPYRLIHHRGSDTTAFFDDHLGLDENTGGDGSSRRAQQSLRSELGRWEQEQLRRIECRLQLSEDRVTTPHLE
ncbi:MAG: sulfatase [Polyangiales bacterium]